MFLQEDAEIREDAEEMPEDAEGKQVIQRKAHRNSPDHRRPDP